MWTVNVYKGGELHGATAGCGFSAGSKTKVESYAGDFHDRVSMNGKERL